MEYVIVTGATSGIGFQIARCVLSLGFAVIGVGHSSENCAKAEKELHARFPKAVLHFFPTELLNQRDVLRAAQNIRNIIGETHTLCGLINNAGGARSRYMTTEDGIEHQFALNYLSGFLLTSELLPLLLRSNGIVIMTSSKSHNGIKVHWNDIMLQDGYNPLTAYKQSKLCDLLFAKAFNMRYANIGVRAYAVDPGLVNTDIGTKSGGIVKLVWRFRKCSGVTPDIPAKTYAFLLSERPNGLYYYHETERKYSKQVTSENADRLFVLSEKLCGIEFGRKRQ